jgi:hypothetical protein
MKLKYIIALFLGTVLGLTSCNDYLDREPEDAITPEKFFTSESDLSAYTVNLYTNILPSIPNGSYGISTFGWDNGTDNQAGVLYDSFWAPGEWKVPSSVSTNSISSPWNFTQIRHCNYFLNKVLPKFDAGQIQGNSDNIKHYIGEAYFLRAYSYFAQLQAVGDFPIVTEALPDNKDTLVVNSKREPRNKVARFILSDLDKAISMLETNPNGGKNRITRNTAYLLRSRVALFEGTWEKYHKGTAFVPGGTGWPGKASDLSDGFNIDTEINYFLTEAMASAKVVADQLVDNLVKNTDAAEGQDNSYNSLNPYFTMFCDENMEGYSEVLMWRAYNYEKGIDHNILQQLQNNGGGSGWTRGLVNSFLMRNGLPIYAANSGYDTNWEKQGIKATLQDRDSRIQQFTKKDGDVDYYYGSTTSHFDPTWIVKGTEETRMVTGFALKKGKAYKLQRNHFQGMTGSITFRGTEALLNYMEACYEKNKSIDASADKYWRALRKRAYVDEDYTKTIAATNMSKEAEGDWGAYSHGSLVDATLYNIRRERRDEFIGEGMRMSDLKRWRALDQVKNYQIEGMRYWGSIYEGNLKDDTGKNLAKVDVSGGTGNISDQSISGVYMHPYQISRINNPVFDGYNFTGAFYLSPIPQAVFRQTATGDQTDLNTSNVYQNPGWSKIAGESASGI